MPIDLSRVNFDEYEDVESNSSQLKANVSEAVRIDPVKHSEILDLSKQSGVPAFAVESGVSEIKQTVKLNQIDFNKISKNSPVTAKFISDDINNAIIGQEDLVSGVLESIEDTLISVGDVTRALPAGFIKGAGSTLTGLSEGIRASSRLTAKGLDAVLPESFDKYLYASKNPSTLEKIAQLLLPSTFLQKEGEGLKQIGNVIDAPENRQNIATDISGAVGQVVQQGIAHTINPTASIMQLLAQGIDQQAVRQEQSGTKGESVVSDIALLAGAPITALSEKTGLDAILNRVPPKIKNDVLRQVTDVALAGGIEAVQEVVENLAHGVLELYTTNPDAEIFQGIDREAVAAGGAGAIVRGFINALVPGRVRSVQDNESYLRFLGEIEQEKIDSLASLASKSELKINNLESFKQFVKDSNVNDGDVFIDGVQTALYLQSKTSEEIDNDPALKALDKASVESRLTGTDVVMTVEDFTGDIAGTEHFPTLRQHITMSADTVSPFRQEEHNIETERFVNGLLNETKKTIDDRAETQDVFIKTRDQLIDTGTLNRENASVAARLLSVWTNARAEVTGKSIDQVYKESKLTIEGRMAGEAPRLRANGVVLRGEKRQAVPPETTNLYKTVTWTDERLDSVITDNQNDEDTDSYIAFINPADFINSTRPDSQEAINETESLNVEGIKESSGIPLLRVGDDGGIVSHEGRDKMDALSAAGVNRVPVHVKFTSSASSTEVDSKPKSFKFKGQESSDGVSTDLNINESYIATPENRESIKSAIRQPDRSPRDEPELEGVRGYYDPANTVIRLNESSNLSTFIHEFGHFMYEMENNTNSNISESINKWFKRNAKDVASEASDYLGKEFDLLKQGKRVNKRIKKVSKDDVTMFLDEGTTRNKDKDSAVRRALHEQFARGFETYLMEGEAPSLELRGVFRTLARWLVNVYKSVKGDLNVNLDAEARQFFDRLLATEEQIVAAESRRRIEPLFEGISEEEATKLREQQEKVKDVQTETLRDKLIKTITNKTKKWWKQEKADLIEEELNNLNKEQVYFAIKRLTKGDLKLDHATVKEMMPDKRIDKNGRKSVFVPKKLEVMTAKGQQGVHPDEAASFFGYGSGSEMLIDIMGALPIEKKAKENAEARMIERHGDVFTDGTIEEAADEAVQNEERGKLILKEWKVMSRNTNQRVIDRDTMKSLAEDHIAKLSFRENQPTKYRKAEIKAAQDAARMAKEGDKEGAAHAKAIQALNYYLGLAATNAKNDTVKITEFFARYNKKSVQQEILKSRGEHWEQIVKILNRFEFRKSATLSSVDKKNQDINTWANNRISKEGENLNIHNAVLDESYTTHWKNVTYNDLKGIRDSVKNIEHVARYANKIRVGNETLEFNNLVESWTDHIALQDKKFETKSERSRLSDSIEASTMDTLRRWEAQLSKMPMIASWLDGGERGGMSHYVLNQRFTDALNDKLNLMSEVAQPVFEAIKNRTSEDLKRHSTKIFIPEINDHLMGHQVIAVALNVGNQGNLRKLLLGEGWASPDNEAEINIDNPKLKAVLSHMSKSDWKFTQLVWDQMEILYPALAEVHRNSSGIEPPKVEAVKIKNEHGVFKGGYYPIKYSRKRSHRAEKNAEKSDAETESMFNNTASIQASVSASSTNERTGAYDSIYLNLEVIPDHFNEVIHYITHHDAVRQVNKLINDDRVADAVTGTLGEAEFTNMKLWLNNIAKDGRQQPVKTYIDEIFQRLRFGSTFVIMGFMTSTGLMQGLGLFAATTELGVGPVVKGVYKTVGKSWYMNAVRKTLGSVDDIETMWNFASERSKILNHRVETLDREYRNIMDRLTKPRLMSDTKLGKVLSTVDNIPYLKTIQEVSMKHIALIQVYVVDLPTWVAAYDKSIAKFNDESKAIDFADLTVENTQGSGATKDMATLLQNQNKVVSTLTMFMTFFSAQGALTRDIVRGARSGLYSPTTVAAKLLFLFAVPKFIEMLVRGELDEDEDDRLSNFAIQTALLPFQAVPFVRDVTSGLISEYRYNPSPVFGILAKGIEGYKQISERSFTDEDFTKSSIKNATKLTGSIIGLPGVSQAWATGEHLYDVMEKGEEFTVLQSMLGPEK